MSDPLAPEISVALDLPRRVVLMDIRWPLKGAARRVLIPFPILKALAAQMLSHEAAAEMRRPAGPAIQTP